MELWTLMIGLVTGETALMPVTETHCRALPAALRDRAQVTITLSDGRRVRAVWARCIKAKPIDKDNGI